MATRSYTDLTLKRLYGRSGNRCAYPQCGEELLLEHGNISDICHIEALNPDGPRYNSDSAKSDKQRNNHPNLILLCRNHHGIIDAKDEDGNWQYSVDQLRTFKREHQHAVNEALQRNLDARLPSLLAQVITRIAELKVDGQLTKASGPFRIQDKIDYNKIDRYRSIIRKYAVYGPVVGELYDEFPAEKIDDILDTLNDIYLINKKPNQSADELLDAVQDSLVARLVEEVSLTYSEGLELCVRIVMVDGFTRCKILEEPAL